MRKRCLPLALVVTMLVGVVGLGAPQHDGTNLPPCCKTARSNKNAPGASIARVCCNLNCSEPGSTSNSSSSNFSFQQSTTSNTALVLAAAQFDLRIVFGRQPRPFPLSHLNPRYIKHLALLI